MTCSEVDIIKVKVLEDYVLYLEFENGCCGTVDIANLISFEGVFAPIKDKNYFQSVFLDKETGTICWDNGADISPAYLLQNIDAKAAA